MSGEPTAVLQKLSIACCSRGREYLRLPQVTQTSYSTDNVDLIGAQDYGSLSLGRVTNNLVDVGWLALKIIKFS